MYQEGENHKGLIFSRLKNFPIQEIVVTNLYPFSILIFTGILPIFLNFLE